MENALDEKNIASHSMKYNVFLIKLYLYCTNFCKFMIAFTYTKKHGGNRY